MKILFGLMLYLMIEYILKFRKIKESDIEKNFLENYSEESYSKRVSDLKQWQSKKQQELNDGGDKENNLESSLITSNCEEQLIESYSNNVSSQKIIAVATYKELLALIKKLGFKLEELTSEEVLYLTMRLDIVGSVPAFFRMKNNGANVILSLKDGCFAFIGNFYMPEHYSKKEIELFTHILNGNQIDSFPMLCVCNSVYNGLEILFFTLHSYKYEEEAFEQILKMFMSFVSIKMEHLFGVKPRLPECITLPVKEEESEK